MGQMVRRSADPCQAPPCAQPDVDRSPRGDSVLAWVNRAVVDTGWSHEALAVHMVKDRSYISRVLEGEKPLNRQFLHDLPHDVEAIVARLYAESFGLIVVAPVAGDEAVQMLVRGLVGVLALRLPQKAGPPVKAKLDTETR